MYYFICYAKDSIVFKVWNPHPTCYIQTLTSDENVELWEISIKYVINSAFAEVSYDLWVRTAPLFHTFSAC